MHSITTDARPGGYEGRKEKTMNKPRYYVFCDMPDGTREDLLMTRIIMEV